MREQRRLLIDPVRLGSDPLHQPFALSQGESHYLGRVLRLAAGDSFLVTDGCGQLWQACLERSAMARLEALLAREPVPRPRITLLSGLVRKDQEQLLRLGTELGCDGFQPLICDHSRRDRGNSRLERRQLICCEAAEQCERLWLPRLWPPRPSRQALDTAPSPGLRRFLCVARQQRPGLAAQLAALDPPAVETLQLALGPEGGWSRAELAFAAAAGWQFASLGPHVLRAVTGGLTALALAQQWRGGLLLG
ncbi:MAG: 16S rRNA (uracil(1498)-N(3))-methyltransferase [Aphanocapsa feldmannii 277cV]|uniref:Ribosomal RNA small subunit methyltransferase E n=2 Tax=Aphanocapsa feldmannii TaxID=192050 RepID=A0A524RKU1_9CHRO|nr:MAG: 16S rRNA (uracil(1498)-N(3))-methyltransferase [Aphanocapsa feldmannii 288cV]TGG90499.1 MAG: 16S rRNA (uracil(1498)-N(3))-methyltransferase [Aphanocapsa feldmannii 277cV]TGH27559.1 MAG: 16S rRNA (uracil(1498)-N(3))-methyltransferase [Aphanocapsa feldmannii 277cI]